MKRIGLVFICVFLIVFCPYSIHPIQLQEEVSAEPQNWHALSNTIWHEEKSDTYYIICNFGISRSNEPPQPFPDMTGWYDFFIWILCFPSDHEAGFWFFDCQRFPFCFFGHANLEKESGYIFKGIIPYYLKYYGKWE